MCLKLQQNCYYSYLSYSKTNWYQYQGFHILVYESPFNSFATKDEHHRSLEYRSNLQLVSKDNLSKMLPGHQANQTPFER